MHSLGYFNISVPIRTLAKTNIRTLQKTQNRALRFITNTNIPDFRTSQLLHEQLDIYLH